jgi:hypothetical protein
VSKLCSSHWPLSTYLWLSVFVDGENNCLLGPPLNQRACMGRDGYELLIEMDCDCCWRQIVYGCWICPVNGCWELSLL